MKELPNNYDREYIFSKDKSIFKKIEHPWVGKPRVYQYPLSDILDINIKAQIINRHHYAELDYDYENRPVVEPQYDIEVVLKSKETVEIYLNNSRIFAEQLRSRILLLLNVKE
jgi:hypothetical protein